MSTIYYLKRFAIQHRQCEMRARAAISLIDIIHLLFLITLIAQSLFVQSLEIPRQQQYQQQQDDDPESRCLSCIRSVTSIGVEPNKRCEGGYYCGPFQFSYQYWAESGKPGNSQGIRDFEKCARDKQCAEQTVKAYFKKFKRDCNNDGLVDCLDMAALHKAGPSGCSSDWFFKSRYWSTFNKTTCMIRRNPNSPLHLDKSELFGSQTSQHQVFMKNQTLTTECLDCICEALSSCSPNSTNNCGSGLVCGPFAISQSYWKDGRRPGASWTACARTKECSSVTIRNYMEKYKRDCNGDGYLTCEDYAAIHRRGPMSCTNRDLLKEQYWTKFLNCRANQKPINDANLVKVNEDSSDQTANLASRGDSASPPTEATSLKTQLDRTSNLVGSPQTLPSIQAFTTVSTTTTTTTTTPLPTTSSMSKVVFSSSETTNNHRPSDEPHATAPLLGLSNQNPTYDLSPLDLENKVTSSQVRTHEAVRPPNHEDHHNGQVFVPASLGGHDSSSEQRQQQDSNDSAQSVNPLTTSTQSSEYQAPQIDQTATNQETLQRRPMIDYSSLPTIIVSKRIESHSTGRISQAHPSKSVYDSSAALEVTSSMATTTSASPGTTFPYNELTTLFSASHEVSSIQQPSAQSPQAATSTTNQINEPSIDYPLSDFAGNGPGVDRASFDRVVNGIVANPDFSKAYPPVPEIIIQRKQSLSSGPPRGPHKDTNQTTKSNNESHSLPGAAGKRENSKTLSPAIYNNPDSDQQSRLENEQSGIGSLVGPNSINMTNLFDKALNESSRIASECLDCICDASSNCDATVQCISKQREKNRCGLYMISWNQFKESDISLTSLLSVQPSSSQNDELDEKLYYDCTTDKNCAEKLIHLYIEKYQKDCNLDGKIDCYDIAAIHRVGPDSCNSNKFLSSQYWRDFNHCYATDRLTTTMQPLLQTSQGG